MNNFSQFQLSKTSINRAIKVALVMFFFFNKGLAQTVTTIQPGSFIINMGVVPQTIGNALKPYGMIYDLISNQQVPIKWVIASDKVKDGVDFNYNGVDYKGGPFIITADYRSAAVNARISYWQTQGVIGTTTTAPIDVPVAMTLNVASVPRWTMDLLNGSVAVPYFTNAGIPSSAYSLTKTPQQLGFCDDIFVMPHAYPQWSTHSNLYTWNLTNHGSIWLSCTAGSELEDMFNPLNHSQQTNFLSEKDPAVGFPTSTVTTIENALLLYKSHTNGSPPYTYSNPGDQFMQFMGTIDSAVLNGLEQIYIPKSPGWRPSTTVSVYDPDHSQRYALSNDPKYRAAIVAYGRGFGDANRGYVMIETGHSLSKATLPANIAAQRIFFNFSFMAGKDSSVVPDVSGIPSTIASGTPTQVSFTFPVGINPNNYTVSWVSACGGSFVIDANDKTKATFNPPALTTATACPITVIITDPCGRIFNTSKSAVISTEMQIVTVLSNACYGSSNGKITTTISGAAGPYVWNWTRSGGGTGSGTGTIISDLAAGNYTVTVISGNGTGSSKTFSVSIIENPQLNPLSISGNNLLCNGQSSGSITLGNVTGGTPPYTYLWSDGITTQSRTNLSAGNYSVTVTDGSNCTVSGNITLTQPTAISVTPTVTNLGCYGNATGAISLATSGGTGTLTYVWNDGVTTQNRTNLAAGIYSVTITDTANCTKTINNITVSQPTSVLSLNASQINMSCNGGSNGSIDLTVSGGTSSYTYLWSNGATTQDITGLAVGAYTVTVTDANGCFAILTKTITQPNVLTISSAVTKATCPGINDGVITLTVTGGTSTYTYSWSGPSSYTSISASPSGLAAGTYNVTVTDAKGCTATATVVVGNTNPSPVTPGIITN